ncbi:hypothetical protein VC83_01283 [Pseudogymnoascus destructans]|uniref:D-xylulose reductase n=2 Tax=Pseudogymnoascus destructans TaxID=655981 RepID=L8G8R7_PSED2|nr:uncharacterized protein VC83_01283 [Pseudogymnoascus destructans]ELR08431.1 hypothetical protein GMDG_00495 [Pseudogymnoascus destructans 20631-21]OAF62242.1 hypothetical protein VC83_01283 [Pseudogymnoascus destructans]
MASLTEGKSNLSFILNSTLNVSYEERPIPTLTDLRSVLVAIAFTGICGSDVHYWQHGSIGPFVLKSPMCLGHESSGTIAAVGPAVTTLKLGDRVAIEPGTPCRHCEPCLSGHYNLCPDMRFAATPPYDGTLTGFYAAPEDFCYKLPDQVSLQEGALVEPLAVAVHITKQAQISPGASVVVMGAGPVGLLCCAVAKASGATKVVSVDIQQDRLDFAKNYASTHTFMPERVAAEVNAENLIKSADLGEGADAVIDASGAEPSIQTSIHVVRRGGVYVQAGMGKPDITFPIMALCTKEITMRGSFRYGSGDYKLAVQLVAGGSLEVKSLVSREVPFKDAEQAFEDVLKGRGTKVLIRGPNHEGDVQAEAKGEEKKEVEAPAVAVAEKEAVAEKPEETAAAPEAEAAAPVEETTKSVATETEPVVESEKADEATENSEPVVDATKADEATEAAAAPAAEESAPAAVEEKTEEAPVTEEKTEEALVTEEPAPVSTEAPADAEAAKPAETSEPAAPVEIPEHTSVLDTIRKIEETAKKTDTLG